MTAYGSPFPDKPLTEELSRFKNAELVWCQEEPKNMGGWSFVDPHLEETLAKVGMKNSRAVYVGREAAASPATGLARRHAQQQEALVTEAITLTGTPRTPANKSK